MFEFQENPVLAIAAVVLGIGIFGASIWVVLRRESSPFRYGVLRGLGICAGFEIVITILMILLVMALGVWGIVAAAILFFVGMNRVFEADFVESIMIVVANLALAKGVEFLLIKLFVATALPYSF